MSESIEQIEDELILVALKFGVSRPIALDMSRALLGKMKSVFGGDTLYIKKRKNEERSSSIKEMFNGVNHSDVCTEF